MSIVSRTAALLALAVMAAALPSAAAQTASTDFEGIDSNDLTIGTPPATARFTSGMSISIGVPELYHSGDYSWMVFGGGTIGAIDFDAPATSVEFWARDSDADVGGLVTVLGGGNAVLATRMLTTDFTLYQFNGLGPIERITVMNVGGAGGSAAVVDDFSFTSLGCFPGPDAANCPDNGLFCDGPERCDAQGGCVSSGNPCAAGLTCEEALDRCSQCVTNAGCNDGVACTDDTCVAGTCVFTAIDARCPDNGLFCDGAERCNAQSGCVSTGNPCAANKVCAEATNACTDCLTDADCDDGVACTIDRCTAGVCGSSASDAACPDNGLFCDGDERCDAELGCVSSGDPCSPGETCNEAANACEACPAGDACDDGDPCTADDACQGGQCAGTPVPGCCADGADCDDADECTDDICVGGVCVYETVEACAESPDADGDGIGDGADQCAGTPAGETPDGNGCACSQLDDDNDGRDDCVDDCPGSSPGAAVNAAGCAASQLDDDGDGVTDDADQCAATPAGQAADDEGCSSAQRPDEATDPPAAAPARRACGLFGMIQMAVMLAGLGGLSIGRRSQFQMSSAWQGGLPTDRPEYGATLRQAGGLIQQ